MIFDSHERYTYPLRDKPYLPSWIRVPMAKLYGFYENHVLRQLDAVIFPCTMDGKNPFEGLCRRTPIITNAAILDEFYIRFDPKHEKKSHQNCYVGGFAESRGITVDMCSAAAEGTVMQCRYHEVFFDVDGHEMDW